MPGASVNSAYLQQEISERRALVGAFAGTLASSLDPASYLRELDVEPYGWQDAGLEPQILRLIMLCARQSGKSTVAAGRCAHKAKHIPGSLHIIVSASEDQGAETMRMVGNIFRRDPQVRLVKDSVTEKELDTGSRVLVLPATEKGVRSPSGPKTIMIDEAAWVEDLVFGAVTPMLSGPEAEQDAELILLSTPHGKRGFFWRVWFSPSRRWRKIFVKPAFRLEGGQFIPDEPEEQFRARWAKRGVQAFYSPRHTKGFLEEMLDLHTELQIRQEYLCEFVELMESVFSDRDIETMFRSQDDVLDMVEDSIFSERGAVLLGR